MRRFLTLARLTTRLRHEQQLEIPVGRLCAIRNLHQSFWLSEKNNSSKGSNSRSSSGSNSSNDSTFGGRKPADKNHHHKTGHLNKQSGPSTSSGRVYSANGGTQKGKSFMGRGGSSGQGGDRQGPEQVKLDKRNHKFTLDLGNNMKARIDFKTVGPNTIEMYHTEVPMELRSRGIGKVLASGALRQAANNNMKVKLTCSYLVNYVNQNQDPSAHIVEK